MLVESIRCQLFEPLGIRQFYQPPDTCALRTRRKPPVRALMSNDAAADIDCRADTVLDKDWQQRRVADVTIVERKRCAWTAAAGCVDLGHWNEVAMLLQILKMSVERCGIRIVIQEHRHAIP